jgi:hypothetical protein
VGLDFETAEITTKPVPKVARGSAAPVARGRPDIGPTGSAYAPYSRGRGPAMLLDIDRDTATSKCDRDEVVKTAMATTRRRAVPMLLFFFLAAGGRTEDAVAEEDAAAQHEAAAQKALTDSLTDALAMLKHGSERAKEQAAASIAQLAIETTISQPFHPVTFRNACVRAGILGELVNLLGGQGAGALHALNALAAIATDDPSTELDNGHALATCDAGAVPPTVRLLASTEEPLQVGAAGLAAVLAENPECQTKLLKAGAVKSLVALASLGGDGAKLRSIAALDMLALNNPAALDAIAKAGE